MRSVIILSLATVLMVSCKKDKKEDTPATPATPTTPTPISYQVSAKVNGIEKHCNSCYSGIFSGGFRDCVLNLNSSTEQIYITWHGVPTPGTYTIVESGGMPSVSYQKSSSFYSAVNGTLNLTSVATSTYGDINTFNATFSFQTDTVKGQFFNITEGNVNVNQ